MAFPSNWPHAAIVAARTRALENLPGKNAADRCRLFAQSSPRDLPRSGPRKALAGGRFANFAFLARFSPDPAPPRLPSFPYPRKISLVFTTFADFSADVKIGSGNQRSPLPESLILRVPPEMRRWTELAGSGSAGPPDPEIHENS